MLETTMTLSNHAKVISDRPQLDEPKTKSMIRIQDFSAWYGTFQALHNLTLDIPENRVTAFIGPSGCGKSTLLKWINRMNDVVPGAHADGTLELPDLNILARSTDVVKLRRRIGIVFQKPTPFPKSIYDNVAFGPRMHFKNLSRSKLDELVEWSLRKAAVWDEVKDRSEPVRFGAQWWTATAALYRQSDRSRARDPVDGRTLLCFGPCIHRTGRRFDFRAEKTVHNCDRDA